MLKLPRNRVACVPIFDTSDSGIKGYENADPAFGYQKPKSGNIVLHDAYRERVDQGLVKYVGAGVTREKNGFGVGDMVIFSGYSGELVSIEGEGLFIILPARFIVAAITPEPTVVSGLFFRSSEGLSIIGDGITDDRAAIQSSMDEVKPNYEYFPATYEKCMELIAQALEETSVLQIKKDRPKLEDYSNAEKDDG